MFAKLLAAVLLLFTFIVPGLCKDNIPEHDNYVLVENSDGTVQNISLLNSLDDDEYYNWNQPVDYNEDYSLNKELKNVILSLYKRESSERPFEFTLETADTAPFDVKLPTLIIVHGSLDNNIDWILKKKDKYFINGVYNIVIVDWTYYTKQGYWQAAIAARKVGQYVGDTLVSLIDKSRKIRARDIHIVGFSLGAHVAGYIGKIVKLRSEQGERIGRITGLDPARLLFEHPHLIPPEKRLVKDDATFVEVIHTCSGILGFRRSIGHVDFWPNSGFPSMPGCESKYRIMCSHARAIEYDTESINSRDFVAQKCTSWAEYLKGLCGNNDKQLMGFYTNSSARGDYYLRTNANPPYSQG